MTTGSLSIYIIRILEIAKVFQKENNGYLSYLPIIFVHRGAETVITLSWDAVILNVPRFTSNYGKNSQTHRGPGNIVESDKR